MGHVLWGGCIMKERERGKGRGGGRLSDHALMHRMTDNNRASNFKEEGAPDYLLNEQACPEARSTERKRAREEMLPKRRELAPKRDSSGRTAEMREGLSLQGCIHWEGGWQAPFPPNGSVREEGFMTLNPSTMLLWAFVRSACIRARLEAPPGKTSREVPVQASSLSCPPSVSCRYKDLPAPGPAQQSRGLFA